MEPEKLTSLQVNIFARRTNCFGQLWPRMSRTSNLFIPPLSNSCNAVDSFAAVQHLCWWRFISFCLGPAVTCAQKVKWILSLEDWRKVIKWHPRLSVIKPQVTYGDTTGISRQGMGCHCLPLPSNPFLVSCSKTNESWLCLSSKMWHNQASLGHPGQGGGRLWVSVGGRQWVPWGCAKKYMCKRLLNQQTNH